MPTEIRCTGQLPRCVECETNDTSCTYDTGRRDRVRQLLEEAMTQKRILVTLAKELRQNASAQDCRKIEVVLHSVSLCTRLRFHY